MPERGILPWFGEAWDARLDELCERWPRLRRRAEDWLAGERAELPVVVRLERELFVTLAPAPTEPALADLERFATGRDLPLHLPKDPVEPVEAPPPEPGRRARAVGRRDVAQLGWERLQVDHPVASVRPVADGVLVGEGRTWTLLGQGAATRVELPTADPSWTGGVCWVDGRAWRWAEHTWIGVELPATCTSVHWDGQRWVGLGDALWCGDGSAWEEHVGPGTEGTLLVGTALLHLGSDGTVRRFHRGRWWTAGRFDGPPAGVTALDPGWCSPGWLQVDGPPRPLEGAAGGIVVPAHGCGAVLLDRDVHRLFEQGLCWVPAGELPVRVRSAGSLPDGGLVVAGEGEAYRVDLPEAQVPLEVLYGSRRAHAQALLAQAHDLGLVRGQTRPLEGELPIDPEAMVQAAGLELVDPAVLVFLAQHLSAAPGD